MPPSAESGAPGLSPVLAVRLAMAVTLAAAAATLLAFAARAHWTLDLLTHFPVQLAIAGFVAFAVLLVSGRRRLAILPLLVFAANVWRPAMCYIPAESKPAQGPSYRLVSANVLSRNRQWERTVEFLRRCDPDFFFVLEMNRDWMTALRQLEEEYPYTVVQPREDNFGIGLFSRAPILRHAIHVTAEAELPSIIATLELDGRELTVVGTHPLPPRTEDRARLRNEQLREIAALVDELPEPKILVGDLNVTPWSPYFADLLSATRLRDARQGRGVQPTWPNVPWPLAIPIDHTLVSHDVVVVDRWVGPNVGSDHLPVVMEFQLAPRF